jgi:hypothetical protein
VIHETVYHFQLWDGATVMPANLDLDWKAYAIPVRTDMPGYRGIGKPKKVECVRLLALYPSDSILWAVQKTVYTPEKVSNTYFTGSSTITRLNGAAQNIPQMLDFHIDFPKHFWNEILKWVKQTKEARDPADVYLDALYDNVTRGLVPK